MHSWPEVRRVLSGCWTLPGLCLLTNFVCGFHEQKFEDNVSRVCGKVALRFNFAVNWAKIINSESLTEQ